MPFPFCVFPGVVEGAALVSQGSFPLSGVTFEFGSGNVKWPGHELDGQSVPRFRSELTASGRKADATVSRPKLPIAVACGGLPAGTGTSCAENALKPAHFRVSDEIKDVSL